MFTSEVFWVIMCIICPIVCMVSFYLYYERLTLSHVIASLFCWFVIIPVASFIMMIGGIVWLLDNSDKIVLLDKDDLRAKRAMKKFEEKEKKKAKEASKLSEALDTLQKQTEDIEKSKFNNNNIKK
jgi:choline-glycine betaine transporter